MRRRHISVSGIFNFVAISDRIATAGQPTQEQFEAARDDGYQVVVNLLPNTQGNALKDEDRIIRSLGLEYQYIPVVWTNPRREDFDTFCDTMKNLGDKKVLIHCAMNLRVTAFFSSYAMKDLGWSRADADALMARVWDIEPKYKDNATWRAFIQSIRP